MPTVTINTAAISSVYCLSGLSTTIPQLKITYTIVGQSIAETIVDIPLPLRSPKSPSKAIETQAPMLGTAGSYGSAYQLPDFISWDSSSVVLKIVHTEVDAETAKSEVENEAEQMKKLHQGPGKEALVTIDQAAGIYGFFMPKIPGTPLGHLLIKEASAVSVEDRLKILLAAAEALALLHRQFVHGDCSSLNILITQNNGNYCATYQRDSIITPCLIDAATLCPINQQIGVMLKAKSADWETTYWLPDRFVMGETAPVRPASAYDDLYALATHLLSNRQVMKRASPEEFSLLLAVVSSNTNMNDEQFIALIKTKQTELVNRLRGTQTTPEGAVGVIVRKLQDLATNQLDYRQYLLAYRRFVINSPTGTTEENAAIFLRLFVQLVPLLTEKFRLTQNDFTKIYYSKINGLHQYYAATIGNTTDPEQFLVQITMRSLLLKAYSQYYQDNNQCRTRPKYDKLVFAEKPISMADLCYYVTKDGGRFHKNSLFIYFLVEVKQLAEGTDTEKKIKNAILAEFIEPDTVVATAYRSTYLHQDGPTSGLFRRSAGFYDREALWERAVIYAEFSALKLAADEAATTQVLKTAPRMM